ncbi:MAG: glycosyl hydrolase, partial [Mucilaginibacter sp.]
MRIITPNHLIKNILAIGFILPLFIGFVSFTNNKAASPKAISADTLARSFASPPKASRPQVFWDWMGGLISKEGITKDLEALSAQGIGGVLVMQMPDQATDGKAITFGDYKGKVKCLSDDWFSMVNFAIGECDRLGITFAIFISPGWSHVGGPWVSPENGLKKLQAMQLEVTGPAKIDQQLPQAPKLLGVGSWKEDIDPDAAVYYKEFAVVAVPVSADKPAAAQDVIDITQYMDATGHLKWNAPAGKWTIIRLSIGSENGKNHPAPP